MDPVFIFFYQSGDVKYFYCSTKVYQTYAAEGLANPRMPFADFACTPFSGERLKLLSSAPQPQSRLGRNEKQDRLRRNILLGGCADSATGLSNKDQTVHTSTQVFLVWQENLFIVLLRFFLCTRLRG
ncbi:hypothetical protein AMECASPLE_024008 [Ameca splendens]|uniref:Uncharacterized protein n=1 Tax=Ameca splendens TaxID=208324 RepID=A0ABV0XHA2_9TELE